MSPISIAALTVSLASVWLGSKRMNRGLLFVAISLLILHVATTVVYYLYAQTTVADARLYYYNPYHFDASIFGGGTAFTIWLTQSLKSFGASYFDCFMVFATIGFLGILLMMRTFEEVSAKLKSTAVPRLGYVALFLPSLHFWTSAIGKDAPVFFALSLSVWALLDLRKRLRYFLFALAVTTLFRPQIALLVVAALGAAALFDRIYFGRKVALLAGSAITITAVGFAIQGTLGVDISSTRSIGSFWAERESIAAAEGGTGGLPFYLSMVSLMLRPFFFDAEGIFGWIASMENVVMLIIILCLVSNFTAIRQMSKKVLFIRFCLILSLATIVLLSLVYYNVGLGLRQRLMVFPPLLSLLVAALAFRQQVPRPGFAIPAASPVRTRDSLRPAPSAR